MKHYKAEPVLTEKYLLGESPFWDGKTDTLSWVDIVPGKLLRMKNGEVSCTEFGEQIGAAIPTEDGGFLVCGTKAIYRLSKEDEKEVIYDLTTLLDERHRSNDAKLDPKGRLFLGSSTMEGENSGNLYFYDGQEMKIIQENTRISNGMAWSKDRKKFYFSDSLFYQVFVYDYDLETGAISNRQVLCDITDGCPDGLTIDGNDNVWVAIWGGSRVECHDGKTGEILAVIDVPAEHVTSCYFYGEKQDQLFITSSGENLNGEFDGCIFTCQVEPVKKQVLLLGDSLRMGYEPFVREKLKDSAEVSGPEENGRWAGYTLNSLRFWIPDLKTPDIVHWNNGLWDLGDDYHLGRPFSLPEEYESALERMVQVLNKLFPQAKIIMATTMPTDNPESGDIESYNEILKNVAKRHDLEVDDLFPIVKENVQFVGPDHIHLNEEGYDVVSDQVVSYIEKYL